MVKDRIYRLVEKGSHGKRIYRVFDYSIMTLIVFSVVSILLESVPEINEKYDTILSGFNLVSVIVFSIEYILRIYVSDVTHPSNSRFRSALKFIFSAYGLMDLLAIVPFYLPMIIGVDLRFIRVIRLFRFLRILKVNRYNDSLILIWTVVKEKKAELTVTAFVTFIVLLLASFMMYYIEGDKQPDKFPNIPATFWWAIATLTTIGYGDVYPITPFGKLLSSIIALTGIGIVALPTGLISAGFMSKIKERNSTPGDKVCPFCGENIEEFKQIKNLEDESISRF